jgi:hypothetical protein
MVKNCLIEYEFWGSNLFPDKHLHPQIYIPYKIIQNFNDGWDAFVVQLGPTFSHQVAEEKRESLVNFLGEKGNQGHDFLNKLGPITWETIYSQWNMDITLTSIYLHQQPIYKKCPRYFWKVA